MKLFITLIAAFVAVAAIAAAGFQTDKQPETVKVYLPVYYEDGRELTTVEIEK